MAKLSANGLELYRKEGLCKRFSFRSNGWILVNSGGGWKRFRKMRAGQTPLEVAESQEAKDRQRDSDYPAYAEYRAILHLAAGIDQRRGLDSMVSANPTDHRNLADDYADKYEYSDRRVVPIATMEKLCAAYLAMSHEREAAKSAQLAQPA